MAEIITLRGIKHDSVISNVPRSDKSPRFSEIQIQWISTDKLEDKSYVSPISSCSRSDLIFESTTINFRRGIAEENGEQIHIPISVRAHVLPKGEIIATRYPMCNVQCSPDTRRNRIGITRNTPVILILPGHISQARISRLYNACRAYCKTHCFASPEIYKHPVGKLIRWNRESSFIFT